MIKKRFYIIYIKISLLWSCLLIIGGTALAQEQKIADSLKVIYEKGTLKTEEKLELLRNLSFHELNDLELALHYADELITLSKAEKNYLYLHRGYYQKGNKLRIGGDLNKALAAFMKSSEAAIKAIYPVGEGVSYSAIADVYSVMGNPKNAERYYTKAITLLRTTDNPIGLASALLNAGDESFRNKKYEKALAYFNESGVLFKKADYLIGTAYNLGNIGRVFAEQGKDELAMKNITEAITILEEFQDYYGISDYLTYMSDIYLKRNNWPKALSYAKRSLDLAKKHGLKEQISTSNLKLSELYQKAGNNTVSYKYFKDHITYRDSVTNLKSVQQMADLRTNFEVSKKQVQVDLLKKDQEIQQLKTLRQRKLIYAISFSGFLIFLMAIGLHRRYQFIKKTKAIIEGEKQRSDNLLLNILPAETAHELKQFGKVEAKKFNSVTIMFTDFKGFTQYANDLSPEKLVESIDYYFSKFDAIIEKHGLEKIKTVGDSYMCAAGLPFPRTDHAQKMILAAIEINDFVKTSLIDNQNNQTRYEIRIGINSGPVVAGVVGSKKFAYDIWGDAVNIASRMESNSDAGRINVSENTYHLIKDSFACEYRGEINVKNIGSMKMYFVNELKE